MVINIKPKYIYYYIIITVIIIIILTLYAYPLCRQWEPLPSNQIKHMTGIPLMWNHNPDVDAEWIVWIIAMSLPAWSNWVMKVLFFTCVTWDRRAGKWLKNTKG